MAFRTEWIPFGPAAGVIAASGRLDFRAQAAVDDALVRARAEGARVVALDLAGLTRADGSGLTVLYRALLAAEGSDLRLALCGLSAPCASLLRELGFSPRLPVYPSRARALGIPERDAQGAEPGCRDGEWAPHLGPARFQGEPPAGFLPRLVEGLPVQTPFTGFGEVWHKTYEIRLPGAGASVRRLAEELRTHLGELWPDGAELWLPGGEVAPGAVGLIRIRLPGGAPLVTGIRILHVGPDTFSFVTLKGHMQAGWITFRVYTDHGTPVARVESLARTGDPVHEVGFRLFGHAEQERFWHQTLERFAARVGVPGRVTATKTRVEARRRWAALANLPANAALRTPLAALLGGRKP